MSVINYITGETLPRGESLRTWSLPENTRVSVVSSARKIAESNPDVIEDNMERNQKTIEGVVNKLLPEEALSSNMTTNMKKDGSPVDEADLLNENGEKNESRQGEMSKKDSGVELARDSVKAALNV